MSYSVKTCVDGGRQAMPGACGLADHVILCDVGSIFYPLPSGTNLSHDTKDTVASTVMESNSSKR